MRCTTRLLGLATVLLACTLAGTTAAADLPPDKPAPPRAPEMKTSPEFVFLTDISSNGQPRANLYDRYNNRRVPLRLEPGFDSFVIRNERGGVLVDAKLVKILARDLVFRAGDRKYVLHVGDSVQDALNKFPGVQVAELPAEQAATDRPGDKPAKTFSFEMRNKPWKAVFEWLSNQTGQPVVANSLPTGTFTFISPQGKAYTIPEIIDVLNEALAAQKFLLLRREQSVLLVPADEKIDPTLVPRVPLPLLKTRGQTELVSVVVPLRTVAAEDLEPDVKKMLGPHGSVVALKRANQLIIQDTVGNLRRIGQMIEQVVDKQGEKAGP